MDNVPFKDDNFKQPNGYCTKKRKTFSVVGLLLAIIVVCVICIAVLLHRRHELLRAAAMQCDLSGKCRFSLPSCNVTIVESIPENLTFPAGSPVHSSIFSGWMQLLDVAESSIHIASSYWSLRAKEDTSIQDPSGWQGEMIFKRLVEAGKRGIEIKIVHGVSTDYQPNKDTALLQDMGLAEVRTLNFSRLLGAGIIHTKMWLVDNKHFYVGSANMDWRSLTQVKELGLMTYNCSCLSDDMAKIFYIYWMLAEPNSKIPDHWPSSVDTKFNKDNPLQLKINNETAMTYLSSSPPQLCPEGRTTDIDSILDVIKKAKKFIHISVMDYLPAIIYTYPQKYWPIIDDALREAAFDRGVQVYLMASIWKHTKPDMIIFLKSLNILANISHVNIEVRLFRVPAYSKPQEKIPYARVQHTKYMVTDNAAYVGTSNWSGDYFISTGGIGYIINQTMSNSFLQEQLEAVFLRDWNSEYTKPIWDF